LLVVSVCCGMSSVSMGAEITRCNAFNDAATTWAAVASGSDHPLPLRSLDPPLLLPDGSEFKTWERPAEHRRTFFVAQNHPEAADENPGTEDRPWKTIGRAAAALEPGDRVIVKEGAYREWVRPARGGLGPRRMITYQAAPGETVVIRGSERFAGPWRASTHSDKPKIDKAWAAELPEALFDGYNPFAEINLGREEAPQKYAKGRHQPRIYTLPRGLVFQEGRRLKQVVEGVREFIACPGSNGPVRSDCHGDGCNVRVLGKRTEPPAFEFHCFPGHDATHDHPTRTAT